MSGNTFKFEFELPGGICVLGTYSASYGRVDQIKFDDGIVVETGPGGWHVEQAPSPFLMVLANEVLRRIEASPVHQFEMEQTRRAA